MDNTLFKSIIFDLDQTLVNTLPLMPFVDAIKANSSGTQGNREAWKEHNRHIKDCLLYDGMNQVFENIRANQIPTAIVSNSCKRRIEAICKAFDIPVASNLIVGRFSVNRFRSITKPDVRIFQKAIKLLGTSPKDVVSFGNEYNDIEVAHKAGVDAVACMWGATEQEKKEMLQAHPDHVINTPQEIIPLLIK